MIGVIADDFTGAAEIGGLGLRYGLKTAICTSVAAATTADLLVIAADTRSKNADAAASDMRELTSGLLHLRPRLLYKKLDSVLRGHVVSELAAQMGTMTLQRALIVPANPGLGRTMNNGIYYVKGKPLHETGFSLDPEFAIGSSHVLDILKSGEQVPVIIGSLDQPLPSRGFVIGEANTRDDLGKWAKRVDKATLPAGASEFFSALLNHLGFSVCSDRQTPIRWGNKKLFICGSSFSARKSAVRKMKNKGLPVCMLPPALTEVGTDSPGLLDQCISDLTSLIARHNYAVLSVGTVKEQPAAETARTIRENMALIGARVMRHTTVNELLLEGGATAAAMLEKLQLEELRPEQEIAHGALRMGIPGKTGLCVTVKPGSYQWPPAIERLLK